MTSFLQLISNNPLLIIFGTGGIIAVTAIVLGSLTKIVQVRSRERTRREIAAYIAEGSMTPEQGERLMRAGNREDA
ncbi:MAG TPA: hypothetical protein ENJ06_03030 [Phycisphaeraceae bacterium]|nr:hypothetical protein [Phycisphaeraceae bacterium]